jgi:hypothetical protein
MATATARTTLLADDVKSNKEFVMAACMRLAKNLIDW